MTGSEGVVCVLSAVHYTVDGSVGVNGGYKMGIRF